MDHRPLSLHFRVSPARLWHALCSSRLHEQPLRSLNRSSERARRSCRLWSGRGSEVAIGWSHQGTMGWLTPCSRPYALYPIIDHNS
jgi:hypothetical protein